MKDILNTLKEKGKKKVGALALAGATLVGGIAGSGCATGYTLYTDGRGNSFLGLTYSNEQKNQEPQNNDNSGGGVMVTTPDGYQVKLQRTSRVYYQGRDCVVYEIQPPYVYISYKEGSSWPPEKAFPVKIKDLDMMKK